MKVFNKANLPYLWFRQSLYKIEALLSDVEVNCEET